MSKGCPAGGPRQSPFNPTDLLKKNVGVQVVSLQLALSSWHGLPLWHGAGPSIYNLYRCSMPNYELKGAEWMREIARLGGKASGARRLQSVDALTRRTVAMRAARARWGKPAWTNAEEEAWCDGWKAGVRSAIRWPRRNRAGE